MVIFNLYQNITVCKERRKKLIDTSPRRSWPLSSDVSLSCHICWFVGAIVYLNNKILSLSFHAGMNVATIAEKVD